MALHTYIIIMYFVSRKASRIYSTLRFKPENDIPNNFIFLMNVQCIFKACVFQCDHYWLKCLYSTPCMYSLDGNEIGPEGGVALGEALTVNKKLQTLR